MHKRFNSNWSYEFEVIANTVLACTERFKSKRSYEFVIIAATTTVLCMHREVQVTNLWPLLLVLLLQLHAQRDSIPTNSNRNEVHCWLFAISLDWRVDVNCLRPFVDKKRNITS